MEQTNHRNLGDPLQPRGLGAPWHAFVVPKASCVSSLPDDSLRHCRALAYLRRDAKVQSLVTWTGVDDDAYALSPILQFLAEVDFLKSYSAVNCSK